MSGRRFFFGEEAVAEVARKARTLPWAAQAVASMTREAEEVIRQRPDLPMEQAGWRHDFYSRATGAHLLNEVHVPDRFRDPLTGAEESLPEERRAWVLLTHERTYRLMRGVGMLYRLTGDERYARWVVEGLRHSVEYFAHSEFRRDDVGGPAHYYSNLYDAAMLALLANAYSLVRQSPALTPEDRARIAQGIFEERMPTMVEFLRKRPTHNMSCFVAIALEEAGRLFDHPEWTALATGEHSGLRRQLLTGLPADARGQADGFWYEGTMFYHFYSLCPLISLWEADRRRGGAVSSDPVLRQRFAAMCAAPVSMVDAELRLPLVGDLGAPRTMNLATYRHVYEYAAGQVNPERFGPVLAAMYAVSGAPRTDLTALAYGPDTLPAPGGIPTASTLLPAAQFGVLRSEHLYVTFRCGEYVGGHDHPDRLGIALNAYGELIAPDLG